MGSQEHSSEWQRVLYREVSAKLLLYGRGLGLGHAEAEDVLQETFVALLKLGHEPRQPEFYVLRAYRNKALSWKRTVMRRFRREEKAEAWFEKDEIPDGAGEALAKRELEKLPPAQREAIILKIWQGCTFEEIGRLLSISPNTAAARYRYGLQKLKKRMEKFRHERVDGDTIEWLDAAPAFGTH